MFFTSMVAAEEKMNSWMIGGRMRAPRARGSRSMVISSLRTMASSRCSTADAPSVQPLVQPPPGEAEEQRSDGQHEQHVGHEHRPQVAGDRKSTRLNSSHTVISYAVFCLKKKKRTTKQKTRQSTNNSRT